MANLIFTYTSSELFKTAQALAQRLQLPLHLADTTQSVDALVLSPQGLMIQIAEQEFKKPLLIDFTTGKHEFRRQHGGGKQQAIAKAIGIKGNKFPTVIDATAGFGSDSFVLASLGCEVTAIERCPIVHALLADALARARHHPVIAGIAGRIRLQQGDAATLIPTLPQAEVIYLDPMFPHSHNTALVKKEMRVIRRLAGDDSHNENLLAIALRSAKHRVVVKRPKLAPFLDQYPPHHQLTGQSNRFDVYLI